MKTIKALATAAQYLAALAVVVACFGSLILACVCR